MTFRPSVLPFQQLARWAIVFALVLAGFSTLPALFADNPSNLALSFDSPAGGPQFDLVLPQRGLALQTATGTVPPDGPGEPPENPSGFSPDDTRVGQGTPGIAAALGAVFPSDDVVLNENGEPENGFVVYAIDPDTGQGIPAFVVTNSQVDAALAEAAAVGTSVLIAPDDGSYPRLYALPSNECMLISLFPDGKEARIIFECA